MPFEWYVNFYGERIKSWSLPNKKEEIGLFGNRLGKLEGYVMSIDYRNCSAMHYTYPALLDHVIYLLHRGVDVVSGEVKYHAKRSDLTTPDTRMFL